MKHKKQDNFLSYIPEKNSNYQSHINEEGRVVITVPHKGLFDRIAQVLFFQPKQTFLKLDALGSFVWQQIDGTVTVGELAEKLDFEFGETAAPLYHRLTLFLQVLHKKQFIQFHKN